MPDVKKFSYLTLVIACHQGKPTLLNIFKYEKMIHLENDMTFEYKVKNVLMNAREKVEFY